MASTTIGSTGSSSCSLQGDDPRGPAGAAVGGDQPIAAVEQPAPGEEDQAGPDVSTAAGWRRAPRLRTMYTYCRWRVSSISAERCPSGLPFGSGRAGRPRRPRSAVCGRRPGSRGLRSSDSARRRCRRRGRPGTRRPRTPRSPRGARRPPSRPARTPGRPRRAAPSPSDELLGDELGLLGERRRPRGRRPGGRAPGLVQRVRCPAARSGPGRPPTTGPGPASRSRRSSR